MGDLVWVRNFFPKSLEKEFFSPTHNSKRFFSSILQQEIFLSVQDTFFPRYSLARLFYPLEISVQSIFSEITHTRLKSQMVDP